MRTYLFQSLVWLSCMLGTLVASGQQVKYIPGIKMRHHTEAVQSEPLFGDSSVTSNFLLIRSEVRPHYHVAHSEHIYIVEGTAQMLLGHQVIHVRSGDLIFVPKGTVHAVRVTGKEPLKVISIHSPAFDGTDRVWVEKTGW